MKKILLAFVALGVIYQTSNAQITNDSTDNSNDPLSIITPQIYQPPTYELNNVNLSSEIISFLDGKIVTYNAYDFNYSDLNDFLLSNPYAIELNLKQGSTLSLLTLQRRDLRTSDFTQTETDVQGSTVSVFERNGLSDSLFIVER